MKIINYNNKQSLFDYLGSNYNHNWLHETDLFISYSVFKNKERTELHIFKY